MRVNCSLFLKSCVLFVLFCVVGLTGQESEPNWKLLSTTSPSARYGASLASRLNMYDSILFGGTDGKNIYSDMWQTTYTSGKINWANITPDPKPYYGGHWPRPRYGAAGAYSVGVNNIIIFGGMREKKEVSSQTFLFTGSLDCYDLSVYGGPAARYYASMVYFNTVSADGTAGSYNGRPLFILFGGQKSDSSYFNDVWSFSYYYEKGMNEYKRRWDKLEAIESPSARTQFSMVMNPGINPGNGSDEIVVFGGKGAGGASNELWTMIPTVKYHTYSTEKTVSWTNRTPTNVNSLVTQNRYPSKRYGHSMVFDPILSDTTLGDYTFIMYGGYDSSGNLLDDTWKLIYNANTVSYTWEKINPTINPGPLALASIGYESGSAFPFIFGGVKGSNSLSSSIYGFNVPPTTQSFQVVSAKRVEVVSQSPLNKQHKVCVDVIKLRSSLEFPPILQFKAFKTRALDQLDEEIPNDKPTAEFRIPVKNCHKSGKYWIVGVDADGKDTAPTYVKIKGKKRGYGCIRPRPICGCH